MLSRYPAPGTGRACCSARRRATRMKKIAILASRQFETKTEPVPGSVLPRPGQNSERFADPAPIGELCGPSPVGQPERPAMHDGKDAGPVGGAPIVAERLRHLPRRIVEPERPAHRAPAAIPHADNDRRPEQAQQRPEMPL